MLTHHTQSPPQSGQQAPGSSSRRARGVASETRGLRRKAGASAASADGSSGPSSMSASSFSATATSRSSSASSSCSISRSIFSEDLPKASFCSLAIRRRHARGMYSECAPLVRRLSQLIMDAQCRRYPGVFCRDPGVLGLPCCDHRSQFSGVIGQIFSRVRHAPDCQNSGSSAI